MRYSRGLVLLLISAVLIAFAHDSLGGAEPGETALAIFERRIIPILEAPNASSCSECHLGGVDLKQYIRPDQAATFAALREAGLIDVERPENSKLLAFIARESARPSLITQRVREQELAAFRAWIQAAVRDPQLRELRRTQLPTGPELPPAVIAHARRDRVLQSFVENIWSEAGRCAACHSPDRNQQQVAKHGEQVSWIKPRDPEGTMQYLLDQGLVDWRQPESSLLLRKPTLQVAHGGGQKMLVGDRTYRQFRRFLDDYAAIRQGRYRGVNDLPKPAEELSRATDIWLKLTDVPANFDGLLLAVDVYRWDEAQQTWSSTRWATGDRAVSGKGRLWQQHLSVVAPRGSPREKSLDRPDALPPGRYLLRIYVDRGGKLAQNPQFQLGVEELLGEVELTAQWAIGYGRMTVARCPP